MMEIGEHARYYLLPVSIRDYNFNRTNNVEN